MDELKQLIIFKLDSLKTENSLINILMVIEHEKKKEQCVCYGE